MEMPMRARITAGLMARGEAETLAVRALAWMAGDRALIGCFLATSGAGPDGLRARSADPEFLGFVLDFLLADETALLAFAGAEGVRPERVACARAALPGGNLPNWT